MVFKLIWPEIVLYSLDSSQKRISFLKNVRDILEINNWIIALGRAEELAYDVKLRETFDAATTRGLAELRIASELVIPFVKQGGVFVAFKGPMVQEESDKAFSTVHLLGGEIIDIMQYVLPVAQVNRTLIVVKKSHKTPKQFQ